MPHLFAGYVGNFNYLLWTQEKNLIPPCSWSLDVNLTQIMWTFFSKKYFSKCSPLLLWMLKLQFPLVIKSLILYTEFEGPVVLDDELVEHNSTDFFCVLTTSALSIIFPSQFYLYNTKSPLAFSCLLSPASPLSHSLNHNNLIFYKYSRLHQFLNFLFLLFFLLPMSQYFLPIKKA